MMTREQRIDYEILSRALSDSRGSYGYATTVPAFLKRLQELFPDMVVWEFTETCKRLTKQNILHLRQFDRELGRVRDYQGESDDAAFLGADSSGLYLCAQTEQGQKCFRQLAALIQVPAGFDRRTRIK